MEATSEFTYQIENNPEPQEIDTIIIYINFVTPVDMDPILTRSRFSRSLPAKKVIKDETSPIKQEIYYFLKDAGVNEYDATMLMQKLTRLALEVTSSVEYCPYYALSIWMTFYLVRSSQEPVIDDSQLEEAIRDDYERNRPASKLGIESLSKRIYKKKRKSSLIAYSKTKRKTSSVADRCTVCLEEFKTGRKVVTLPCGHEFDNKCIVEWFKVNHVCPLCRFELPCEDDNFSLTTTTL